LLWWWCFYYLGSCGACLFCYLLLVPLSPFFFALMFNSDLTP